MTKMSKKSLIAIFLSLILAGIGTGIYFGMKNTTTPSTTTTTIYSDTGPCDVSPCPNNFECAANSAMAECTCSGASCDISGKLLINVTLSLSID